MRTETCNQLSPRNASPSPKGYLDLNLEFGARAWRARWERTRSYKTQLMYLPSGNPSRNVIPRLTYHSWWVDISHLYYLSPAEPPTNFKTYVVQHVTQIAHLPLPCRFSEWKKDPTGEPRVLNVALNHKLSMRYVHRWNRCVDCTELRIYMHYTGMYT